MYGSFTLYHWRIGRAPSVPFAHFLLLLFIQDTGRALRTRCDRVRISRLYGFEHIYISARSAPDVWVVLFCESEQFLIPGFYREFM